MICTPGADQPDSAQSQSSLKWWQINDSKVILSTLPPVRLVTSYHLRTFALLSVILHHPFLTEVVYLFISCPSISDNRFLYDFGLLTYFVEPSSHSTQIAAYHELCPVYDCRTTSYRNCSHCLAPSSNKLHSADLSAQIVLFSIIVYIRSDILLFEPSQITCCGCLGSRAKGKETYQYSGELSLNSNSIILPIHTTSGSMIGMSWVYFTFFVIYLHYVSQATFEGTFSSWSTRESQIYSMRRPLISWDVSERASSQHSTQTF